MARIVSLDIRSVLILWMVGLALLPAGVMAQEKPKITVTIYNRSDMPSPTLMAGEGVAQSVLRQAGVESVWVNCPIRSTAAADVECNQPPNRTKLVLTVVPHWADRRVDPRSLGLAVEVEHGFGSYCYVFQDRLNEVAA